MKKDVCKSETFRTTCDYNDFFEYRYVIYKKVKSWFGREYWQWEVSFPYTPQGQTKFEAAVNQLKNQGHIVY